MNGRFAWSLVFGVLLLACAHPSDEVRIRNAIEAMRRAVVERRPHDFLDSISADFVGNDGAFDRERLHDLLRIELLRNELVTVTLPSIEIELIGDRATVRVVAVLTGSSGGLLPERGEVYTIVSGWRREDGVWRCLNARWSQSDPEIDSK
jgi:hypothetical protein